MRLLLTRDYNRLVDSRIISTVGFSRVLDRTRRTSSSQAHSGCHGDGVLPRDADVTPRLQRTCSWCHAVLAYLSLVRPRCRPTWTATKTSPRHTHTDRQAGSAAGESRDVNSEHSDRRSLRQYSLVLPAKPREYVFTDVGLCVCLSVCDRDNYNGRICTKFYGKVLMGKRNTKFVFRYDRWSDVEVTVKKLREPAVIYILYFTNDHTWDAESYLNWHDTRLSLGGRVRTDDHRARQTDSSTTFSQTASNNVSHTRYTPMQYYWNCLCEKYYSQNRKHRMLKFNNVY